MVSDEQLKKNKYRRKKVMLKRVHTKGMVALVMVVVILMALGGQVFRINYTHGETYAKAVLDHQTYTSTELPYKRGQILTGDGTVLAYSERVYNLILDVKLMLSDGEYKEPTLSALCKYFNLNRSELEQKVSENSQSRYQKLLSNLTTDQIADFKNLMADSTEGKNIKGVWFEDSYIRKYPLGTFASDVVGFASATNGGELGIESQYDEELTGTNGTTYSYVDEGLEVTETQKNAVDGNNIVTTLDYNVQSIIEKCILEYNEEKPSKNTAVVVADPSNGEILGMASYPTFNLNDPRKLTGMYTDEEIKDMSDEEYRNNLYSLWTNYCVSESYEPGSTFKTVTAAAALEAGVVTFKDTFSCPGFYIVEDRRIRCHKVSGHGSETFLQGIQNSCNPVFIQVGLRLGAERFYSYFEQFELLEKTGIDLPGEARTIMHDPKKIGEVELATISFGQSFQLTTLRLLTTISSFVNGGHTVVPHFGMAISSFDGTSTQKIAYPQGTQVLDEAVSAQMRECLESVVAEGGGNKAYIEGYRIGGKTATSEKLPRGTGKYISSFVGFAPADDPQVIIIMTVDEPQGIYYGGTIVAPKVKKIFENILPYLNL